MNLVLVVLVKNIRNVMVHRDLKFFANRVIFWSKDYLLN